jgi:hypothetical protein
MCSYPVPVVGWEGSLWRRLVLMCSYPVVGWGIFRQNRLLQWQKPENRAAACILNGVYPRRSRDVKNIGRYSYVIGTFLDTPVGIIEARKKAVEIITLYLPFLYYYV